MWPPIGEIVSKSFYDGRLEHGRVTPVIDPDALPPLLAKPVTWIDTAPLGERGKQSDPNHRNSLSNADEADAVVAMLKEFGARAAFIGWLGQQTAHAHTFGVICAYCAQRVLVRERKSVA